ncbi:MAG: hypothetical protein AAF567_18105 [Actinomycetota bacterium]
MEPSIALLGWSALFRSPEVPTWKVMDGGIRVQLRAGDAFVAALVDAAARYAARRQVDDAVASRFATLVEAAASAVIRAGGTTIQLDADTDESILRAIISGASAGSITDADRATLEALGEACETLSIDTAVAFSFMVETGSSDAG